MVWERGGTDLLLTAGMPPLMRVDGAITPMPGEPVIDEDTIRRHLGELLAPDQSATFERHLDVDFTVGWEGKARLRGNAFSQKGLPTVALRIIPEEIPSFDELLIPESVRRLATLPQGLILVTGPTGSGKSTTQAALVDHINTHRACHVLTIEDPIEYVHRHKRSVVHQREIGADAPSFERALRSALREDPDVLLVGEMRDPESIAITLTMAETGHLVMSTLHTNDASQALDRVVDVFPAERQAQIRLQLASSLVAVVAQRLLPKVGGGLVAAFEVLLGTQAVRNLIREGKTRQLRNVITTSRAEGMQTLEHSLNERVAAGLVTYEDAMSRALFPNEIERPAPVVPPPPPAGSYRAR